MDAFKRFSLVAMAALLAAGTAPAFAQTRDTRPERPVVERDDSSGSGATETRQEPRLPKPTEGVRCLIKQGHDGPAILAVNGTGKVIPAGTVVTLYLQPGNIQKLFKLDTDWQPGQSIGVPVKLGELPEGAACSMKVTPVEDKGNEGTPDPDGSDQPPDGGDAQPPGPMPDLPTGEGDPAPPVILDAETTCQLRPTNDDASLWGVDIQNLGPDSWPVGTQIHLTLPNGTELTITLENEIPVGDYYAAYNLFPKPQNWTCKLYLTAAP